MGTQIDKRSLGSTGIEVTALGFGSMELRGEGHNKGRAIDHDDGGRLLNAVLDSGITFIDSSADYGAAEELIGAHLAGRRDEFVLATKCGCPVVDHPTAPRPLTHDFSRANIVEVFERSLRRLRTDRVDLLQLHASPSRSVLEREDTIATMLDLVAEGKVRFIGVSSVLPALAEHVEIEQFDSIQLPYSALERGYEQYIAAAGERGKAVVVRGGVAKGEPRPGQPWPASWELWTRAGLDDLLDGESRNDFMLRFTLGNPAVSTVIVGTLDPRHLESNVRAATRGPLEADRYTEAVRRLDAATSVRAEG